MRFQFSNRDFPFRLVSAAALVVYLGAATGVPLPMPGNVDGLTDERFPCERSGCGCSSARQCWSDCCCRTLAANLAWARAEGVRPPEFALALARAQGLDTTAWDGPAGRPRQVLVAKAAAQPTGGCCCRAGGCCEDQRENEAAVEPPDVVVLQSLACQGLVQAWLALGATTPPPAPVEGFVFRPYLETIEVVSEAATSSFDDVDLPPPKLRVL